MKTKNKKNSSLLSLVIFIIAFLLLGPNGILDKEVPTSENSYYEIGQIKRVVDGDTAIVSLDNEDYRLRFIGINTPEYNLSENIVEPLGKEASDYSKKILQGQRVYLEKDKSDQDHYGRLLRYVWLKPAANPENPSYSEIRNNMVNAIIIDQGYSKAKNYPPDDKYFTSLKNIEKDAKVDNKDKLR